jgi:hypothetical protein
MLVGAGEVGDCRVLGGGGGEGLETKGGECVKGEP